MAGKISGNLAHKFRGNHNLDTYDGLKKHRFCMIEGVLEGMCGRYLERCLGRVDVMIRTIVQSYLQVYNGMSNQYAFIQVLRESPSQQQVCIDVGIEPPTISSTNSNPVPLGSGSIFDMYFSVLPMTTRLFFVLILRL